MVNSDGLVLYNDTWFESLSKCKTNHSLYIGNRETNYTFQIEGDRMFESPALVV